MSEKRKQVTVQILQKWRSGTWLLPEFLAIIEEGTRGLSDEQRAAVVIEFQGGNELDSGEFTISYVREETNEEMAQRLAKELEYKRRDEVREREQLVRLLAKYGRPIDFPR